MAGQNMINIGTADSLAQANRYTISLRSPSLAKYHSFVLYKFEEAPGSAGGMNRADAKWHAMEEECPHLGASMSEATIEIEDDEVIAICPWHSYDFNVRTGASSTGLKACVFPVTAVEDHILLGSPSGANDWELVSVRPVSQRFATGPLMPIPTSSLSTPPPKTLTAWGSLILATSNPMLKVSLTREAVQLFRTGQLPIIGSSAPLEEPPRDKDQIVVEPGKVGKRGKGGTLESRCKLLHALANIEQWAIDLAWDIMVRFAGERVGPEGKGKLPLAFFSDFCKVAEDEAKHFTLLREALLRLGSDWGSYLPTMSARDTSHSLVSRLCIIHLVHEARGLDVNPIQIKRVKAAGDTETAASLEIIHADEITHVAAGHRWLLYLCQQAVPELDPVQVFRNEVTTHFVGKLKPPFNASDRAKAGLEPGFYEGL